MVKGRYLLIKHSETGEELVIDKYMSRYKRLGYAFLNSIRLDRRFVKHITLTQKVESYKPKILNYFMSAMRRYYGSLIYIWTSETQEERYATTGQRVLHWHCLVGFEWNPDYSFGRDDIERIQGYWKYGNVDIQPVRKPSVGYVMKYIQKALDIESEEMYKVRRIGSSLFAGWLRQSWSALCLALSKFTSWGIGLDGMKMFEWSRGNAYTRDASTRERLVVYQKPPSGWSLVWKFDFNPQGLF